VFFKQIKQKLQLADFLGQWQGSFRRLFTLLRGVLFSRLEMFSVLEFCGTARGSPRMIASPQQAYLPGFERLSRKK
jgi:hypothetical protein